MASWHTLTGLLSLMWSLPFSWECEKEPGYSSSACIPALRDQGRCQLTRRHTKKAECPAHKGVKVTAVAHHYDLLPVVQIFGDVLQQEEHRLGSCDLRTSTKNKIQPEPEHFNMRYGLSHTLPIWICSSFGTRGEDTRVNRRTFEKLPFWIWEHGSEHSMSTMEMIRALMKPAPIQDLALAFLIQKG